MSNKGVRLEYDGKLLGLIVNRQEFDKDRQVDVREVEKTLSKVFGVPVFVVEYDPKEYAKKLIENIFAGRQEAAQPLPKCPVCNQLYGINNRCQACINEYKRLREFERTH